MVEMGTVSILSIDWDYFPRATMEDRLEMFPDGGNEDIDSNLLDFIWQGRYASFDRLDKIETDLGELDELYRKLDRYADTNTPIMVSDSHRYMYGFTTALSSLHDMVHVYNIDFHHDLYGIVKGDNDVDCGNWGNWLYERGGVGEDSSYVWVSREDSDGPEGGMPGYASRCVGIQGLELPDHIDGIYICRSGVWSPPHLDSGFIQMYTRVMATINPENSLVSISGDVEQPRWDDTFAEMVESQREVNAMVMNSIRVTHLK